MIMQNQTLQILKTDWSKAEKNAWRLPKKRSVSEWADENRFLDPMTSAEPGRWLTARTPYLREPMDAVKERHVRQIILMMSTQVGKTECMLNMLAYHVDQDPAPALWVMARESDARGMCEDRVEPMIRLSPALSDHMTGREDDLKKTKLIMDRMIVYMQGSNSPAGLASKPIRLLFLDEVDKYPSWAGKEADPIKLAEERTRTFWNRKHIKCSTPTTRDGYIFREYQKTDKRRFYIPCTHCGKYQILVFPQIAWPEGVRDVQQIRNEKLAYYECMHCKKKISDIEKQQALNQGVWVPDGCSVNDEGIIEGEIPESSVRGYWINALYSPWLTFSDIAAEFLLSKDNPEELMNFVNSWLAEVWEEKLEETRESQVRTLALDYEEGIIPEGVLVLTAGVDVQEDHFYFVIRGWGYGEESWLIRAARVESWQEVTANLFQTDYKRFDGEQMKVILSCVDSGFRTHEVYEVCRFWRDLARPIKGMDKTTGVPYSVTRIEKHAATGRPIEGGISLWKVDTAFYKNKITRMMHSEEGDPAKWHIFKNYSDTYVKQICSEHKVIERNRQRGTAQVIWKTKGRHTPNHYWDAEVYATAAADMLHVSALRKDSDSVLYAPQADGLDHGTDAWLKRRRGGWMRRG